MEHKAYIFDYIQFKKELAPILVKALASNDVKLLREFILKNKQEIKTPWDGDPIENNWEKEYCVNDVHHYGDFALTKYYDPSNDQELMDVWQDLDDEFYDYFLGCPLGPEGNYFDLGKYGSYFLSPNQVVEKRSSIEKITDELENYQEEVESYIDLLKKAEKEKKGVYITF